MTSTSSFFFLLSIEKISPRVPDIKDLSKAEITGHDVEIKAPGNKIWKREEYKRSLLWQNSKGIKKMG